MGTSSSSKSTAKALRQSRARNTPEERGRAERRPAASDATDGAQSDATDAAQSDARPRGRDGLGPLNKRVCATFKSCRALFE